MCRASQALGQRATRLFPQQGVLRPVVLYGGLSWVLRKVEQYSWPFPLNVRGTLSMTTTDGPSVPRGRVLLAWEYSALQRSLEACGGLERDHAPWGLSVCSAPAPVTPV